MRYDYLIFDFDGTVMESAPGITESAAQAMVRLGYPRPDAETLRKFIGPPLFKSFEQFCGLTEQQAEEAVRLYRERYGKVGLFEANVYTGLPQLLRALRANGAYIAVASGKPEAFIHRILAHFGLADLFDAVAGPDPMNKNEDKTEQVLRVLPKDADLDRAVMIGDRRFDMEAGCRAGLHTLGVSYGYGTREELENSGAEYVANTVSEMTDYLLDGTPCARGFMFSLEGTDGCGKSTQSKLLCERLSSMGYELVTTREPGGCPISEKIRELLLSLDSKGMSAECEALLYAAARIEHVREVVVPALNAGKIVICDRYVDSSIAYQAYGRELGEDFIRQINRVSTDTVMPDCTLQFDIDREAAKARVLQGAPMDRLEIEKDDFFCRVQQGYDAVANAEPGRVHRIDSGRTIEEIHADVMRIVMNILTRR